MLEYSAHGGFGRPVLRRALFAATAGALLLTAGCDQGRGVQVVAPPQGSIEPVASLNCPESSADLTRVSAAPDGRSCAYRGPDGETVDLSLVSLDGAAPKTALQPIEADLRGDLPTVAGHGATVKIDAEENGGGRDRANIDLPGFHIHADGDKAQIQLPGVSINADGDKAQVHAGWAGLGNATVNAHEGGAEIRAGGVGPQGANLTYVLASDTPGPSGYRAVGYIARGPSNGPLVVAVFKAKTEDRGGGRRINGLDHLLALNMRS